MSTRPRKRDAHPVEVALQDYRTGMTTAISNYRQESSGLSNQTSRKNTQQLEVGSRGVEEEEDKLDELQVDVVQAEERIERGFQEAIDNLRKARDDRMPEDLQQGESSYGEEIGEEEEGSSEDEEQKKISAEVLCVKPRKQPRSQTQVANHSGGTVNTIDRNESDNREPLQDIRPKFARWGPSDDQLRRNRAIIGDRQAAEDGKYLHKLAKYSSRGRKGIAKKFLLMELHRLSIKQRKIDTQELVDMEQGFMSGSDGDEDSDASQGTKDVTRKQLLADQQAEDRRQRKIMARMQDLRDLIRFAQDSGEDSTEESAGESDCGANQHPLWSIRHELM